VGKATVSDKMPSVRCNFQNYLSGFQKYVSSDSGVFCPTPQKGIFQGLECSVAGNEVWSQLPCRRAMLEPARRALVGDMGAITSDASTHSVNTPWFP